MLIMVFVFGCVQFAYAETTADFVYGEDASKYISFEGKMLLVVKSKNEYFTCFYSTVFITPTNRRIALLRRDNGDSYSFDVYLENNSVVESGMISSVLSRQETGKTDITTSFSSSYGPVDDVYLFNGQNISGIDKAAGELVSAGCPVFDNKDDINTYLNTGEINNPIYQPTVYDESIPTPSNITLTFNCELGDSFKLEEIGHPFTMTWDNIQNGENQVNYDDLTFECYVDMGYWAYKDIFGHHNDKTTGKIKLFDSSATSKYKTCDKLGKNSDWDTWFSSIKLDVNAFGMLGQYYDFYCRYVDSSGNYGNWVKIHVSGSNSTINRKWGVIKDIDATTTINKGYEEIDGNNGEHVSGDYDNYYVGNSDGNFSNNLTSLKNNYSNLINFFK